MAILVTFADGHSTLVIDRAAADQIVAYWPQLKATVRDLDQEARDREEMAHMLNAMEFCGDSGGYAVCYQCRGTMHMPSCALDALLKRLGRLP